MSQNNIDPTRVYSKLADLYAEVELVHRASGDALVEIINALSRKTEGDAMLLAAFHHLVPRPISAAQAPDRSPEAPVAQPPSMPWDAVDPRVSTPPPLPDDDPVAPPGTYPESEAGNAFGARLAERTRARG